ncbi:MAG: MBL fold metallo-hydrolase [Nitrospirae bacterium]|nr:MBL fold metallo-hydrolase [Nitrospirota bacterium]
MVPLEDEVGDIIRKARTGLGLTTGQTAERAGMPVSVLEEIELCSHTLSQEEAGSLAKVLSLNSAKLYESVMGLWHPEEPSPDALSDVVIIEGSIGAYKVNGYILIDKASGEAAAFDTANDSKKVLDALQEKGVRLKYLFLTHCHTDHTGGLEGIFKATEAGIGIPEGEASIGFGKEIPRGVFYVKDDSEFSLGQKKIRSVVIAGHTQGSTCYMTRNYCFSGDTLFAGSVGRAYSPEAYRDLLHSLQTRILALNEGVYIFPGHGPVTTVGEEIRHNPFF